MDKIRVTRYKEADTALVYSADIRETIAYLQKECDAHRTDDNYFGLEAHNDDLVFSWVEEETDEEYERRKDKEKDWLDTTTRRAKRQEINQEIIRLQQELNNV